MAKFSKDVNAKQPPRQKSAGDNAANQDALVFHEPSLSAKAMGWQSGRHEKRACPKADPFHQIR
jgi:hypothetical protein